MTDDAVAWGVWYDELKELADTFIENVADEDAWKEQWEDGLSAE